MAQAEALPLEAGPPEGPALTDAIICLSGATWADYQRLLEIRGERSVPRLTYLAGALEIMSPSRPHESLKSMIGRLMEAYCMERDIGVTPYGSWTLESKEDERGIEPDECYVLGDEAEPECADLAIEVIWTSGSVDKLEVYRKLGVREVWIWRKGALTAHGLRGDAYSELSGSELIAGIDFAELLSFVHVRPMTRAVREYREAVARRLPR